MPTIEQRINDANEAKLALAEDSVLTRAFDALEREYMRGWRATATGDHQIRESYYNRLRVLLDVREAIQRVIADGSFAAHEAERIRIEETSA